MVQVEGTVVTEDTLSSGSSTGRATAVLCKPPLETNHSLAPGESLECTANIAIIQDDINRGEVLKRRHMIF